MPVTSKLKIKFELNIVLLAKLAELRQPDMTVRVVIVVFRVVVLHIAWFGPKLFVNLYACLLSYDTRACDTQSHIA
jgi:hypothetical protein